MSGASREQNEKALTDFRGTPLRVGDRVIPSLRVTSTPNPDCVWCKRHGPGQLCVHAFPPGQQHIRERCPLCHRPDDHHPHNGCPGRCAHALPPGSSGGQ